MFTGKGVPSDWYVQLNKAPWTPPGWVFGVVWTIIMICFAFYLSSIWNRSENKTLFISLFSTQWLLNIAWNPVFFYWHQALYGLVIISALTILMGYFLVYYWHVAKAISLLVLPYFLWLLIATSLNGYVVVFN
jgi:tryptophan-rich sensory protein